MAALSVADIAARCGGRVVGDGGLKVSRVRSLEAAGPSDLAFVADAKAERAAADSKAGALLVRDAARFAGRTTIEVADPSRSLADVLLLFFPRRKARPGVHATAIVGEGALVDPSAEIGPYAVVGAGARVGPRAIVEAHAVVGPGSAVGDEAWLHPHVVLYEGVSLGPRTEVHAGAVLGSDGFGYAPGPGGIAKVPQAGSVEIGANSCVDRATLEATRVGDGTKIDDLVMVGHNSAIGRHVILCGQVGLAGSTIVGDGVVLAGQVGVAGHLTIGPGAKAGAQTGISSDVPAGETVFGTPHMSHREALRAYAELRRLPETARALRTLLARDPGRETTG